MRLSLISAIAALGSVVMAQPVARALTSPQVSEGLKILEKKAKGLQAFAQPTALDSLTTSLPTATGQGPFQTIIIGNIDILLAGTNLVAQLKDTKPFKAEDCTAITGSFKDFSAVNQVYFNHLVGKSAVLNGAPHFGPPVATSLKQVHGVYKTLSDNLIAHCASTAKDLTSEAKSLEATLNLAISKYEYAGKINLPN